MNTLVFDTETTGLARMKLPDHHPDQPGMVQLGAILYADGEVVSELNVITVPIDSYGRRLLVPPEASKVHGITDEVVDRNGISPAVALDLFDQLVFKADRVVAFNAAFDGLIIAALSRRVVKENPLWQKPLLCAMLAAEPVCKLPKVFSWQGSGGGYKWPSLKEAYRILVDQRGFSMAHDAMADVKAAASVLWALEDARHPLVEIPTHGPSDREGAKRGS